jgi:hypothetical protein
VAALVAAVSFMHGDVIGTFRLILNQPLNCKLFAMIKMITKRAEFSSTMKYFSSSRFMASLLAA